MSDLEISVPIGVSVRDLSSITNAFAGLYAEIGKSSTSAEVAELRMTGHRSGSLVLECEPVLKEDADPMAALRTGDVMIEGLSALAKGTDPLDFSNTALRHAATFVGSFTTEDAAVVVSVGKRRVRCTTELQTTARAIANRTSFHWGSVEGRIESASIRSGRRRFNLYELLSDEKVECRFKPELLDEVGASLGRRVVVSGEIHMRGDEIDYADVERFEPRPPQADLPTFADIRGLFRTNGD